MQPLIRITTTPIQYQYDFEPARLEPRKTDPLMAKIEYTEPELKQHSRPIEVRLDMSAMRDSMGIHSSSTWAKKQGENGWNKVREGVDDTVHMGNQMARIDDGLTIAQIVRSKAIENPTTYTAFLPSVGPDISWKSAELDMDYDPGDVDIDWQLKKLAMDYIPGKFSLVITQYPKVSVEYLGGIRYTPPSADPNYNPPKRDL
jgi:hypothetical protein